MNVCLWIIDACQANLHGIILLVMLGAHGIEVEHRGIYVCRLCAGSIRRNMQNLLVLNDTLVINNNVFRMTRYTNFTKIRLSKLQYMWPA